MEEIKKYDISYYGGGKNSTKYPYRAIIGFRKDDGTRLGAAYFHRDPSTMPETDQQNSEGYIFCHYLWEDFPMILDTLRNEAPVYLRYIAGGWNMSNISTSLEPIGEGEPTPH